MRKTALTALSTALILGVLGAGSLAIAGDRDDGPSGGTKIGPQGQVFGTPNEWRGNGQYAYGFAPSVQSKLPVHAHGHRANVR
jgi:hypothetical protein